MMGPRLGANGRHNFYDFATLQIANGVADRLVLFAKRHGAGVNLSKRVANHVAASDDASASLVAHDFQSFDAAEHDDILAHPVAQVLRTFVRYPALERV
jgi:hypothetical protein